MACSHPGRGENSKLRLEPGMTFNAFPKWPTLASCATILKVPNPLPRGLTVRTRVFDHEPMGDISLSGCNDLATQHS